MTLPRANIRKKILHVLGGGLWQVPTIQRAKARGYDVFVTDMYENTPGYAVADAHEVIDIRDKERTLDAARRYRIDGIVCDTTDVGVPTAAYVAERLALPGIGYDTALRFTNKYLMRESTAKAGIDSPRYALVLTESDLAAAEALGFPAIVKPADNQSSRGVRRVENADELRSAFADAMQNSTAAQVLVEEWIVGTEVTVEAMCFEGRSTVLGISDKEHYAHQPQIASCLTYPPAMSRAAIDRLGDVNEAVTGALGLRTGMTHAEYIVTETGRVVLVEIAARGGGTRIYSHIVPFLSGVDAPALWIDYCLGDMTPWPARASGNRAAILDFFEFPAGFVTAVDGVEAARAVPGVADLAIELEAGRYFAGIDNDRARPGYVVAFGSSRDDVRRIADVAKRTVRVAMA